MGNFISFCRLGIVGQAHALDPLCKPNGVYSQAIEAGDPELAKNIRDAIISGKLAPRWLPNECGAYECDLYVLLGRES